MKYDKNELFELVNDDSWEEIVFEDDIVDCLTVVRRGFGMFRNTNDMEDGFHIETL